MKKSYISLATLIHESKTRFCLGKLLLGNLYDELGLLVEQLQEGTTTLKVGGPLWLAQLWMNVVFKNFMVIRKEQVPIKLPMEGFQLAHLEQNFLEKATQKRKTDPSKQTSKRARRSSKASFAASNPQEDLPQKSVSSFTRLLTIKDSQQDSGVSPKEVSSKSKENSPLKKNSASIQIAGQVHQSMNEKTHSPSEIQAETPISSSKGYSPSPEYVRNLSPKSKIDALIDQDATCTLTNAQVQNVDIPGAQINDTLQVHNTSNPLNLTSKKLVSQIPITIEDDSDLEDLVKVIFETKGRSEQGVSLSEAKSVHNLIRTRDMLNNIKNETANVKENNDNFTTAEETMKEKCSRYEKHIEEASLTLESYSKNREDLERELAAIQAKIKDIDDKVAKIRGPFEKTRLKKKEIDANLARIVASKSENLKTLKGLKNEELEEMKLMAEFDKDRLELKTFLERFLKEK
ncbi:hypothetical protein PIB30_091345 [Stylosanthes scabra]|uniref:Uncharacterized protein n=1 Tax=Stylosanthes scabra TaxID=79078 RepID=A0ABU6VWD8_9FABA|nr:hypothetical protein [Stylosanthes scabra]